MFTTEFIVIFELPFMNSVKFVGILSNHQRVSEEPFEENETRTVMTIDGYRYKSLLEYSGERLELFRIEIFNPTVLQYCGICPPEERCSICEKQPLILEMYPCTKPEANAGVYSYFKDIQEEYRYYQLRSVNLAKLDENDLILNYFDIIRSMISSRLKKTWYRYKTKQTSYIKTQSTSFYVEPVGQGSMAVVSDSKGQAKILFDVGHGTPIDKVAITQKKYKFNDKTSNIDTVFLSHWDEDHYQLANHKDFSFLKEKFWFMPFSKNAIVSMSVTDAIAYEPRLLVWETILDITNNYKFYIIEHGEKGRIPISANKAILYECGYEYHVSNDRGLVFTFQDSSKNSSHNVLIPGDADYLNFPEIYSSSYTAVVATHHGSKNLLSDAVPTAMYNGAKFILSFGFNDRYKHPSFEIIKKAIRSGFSIYPTSLMNWRSYNLSKTDKLRIFNNNARRVKVI